MRRIQKHIHIRRHYHARHHDAGIYSISNPLPSDARGIAEILNMVRIHTQRPKRASRSHGMHQNFENGKRQTGRTVKHANAGRIPPLSYNKGAAMVCCCPLSTMQPV